jgi:site-specific DNA recombinase
MTTAIYARCSKEESKVKGLSIPDQLERCRARAAELGLQVVHEFTDEGLKAGRESKDYRPGFEEMIARAKSGEFSHIISLDTARFGRDHIEAEIYERLLEKHGIKVLYVLMPFQEGNPYTEILRMFFRRLLPCEQCYKAA